MPRVRELIVQYRAHPARLTNDDQIVTPERAAALLIQLLAAEPQENFVALHLDAKRRLIGIQSVSRGNITETAVPIRAIIGTAIATHNSVSIILGHNHPSGDPEPSLADLILTGQIKRAASLFNLEVADHIIIGDGRYCSLQQTGRMEYLP